jgi:Mitochondrial biogenesis AIM24
MIAMSPTVTLKGAVKFSMKKLLVGGEMAVSNYTATLGDISLLRLNGTDVWNVGKDAFMAATQGVIKEYKSQSFSKAMFSGEGMFVYKMSGTGILWISSFGAIIRKDVSLRDPQPLANPLSDFKCLARRRRTLHNRQRPPCRLELQVCPRARRLRGNYLRHHVR